MVALEGDKFMKSIMVAAGATLDGGVWEPHFVPSTVKMASPEYHGLLAHYYIPKVTAQIGMDFVMQEDGAPSHRSAMTRKWRSDVANWTSHSDTVHAGIPCKFSRSQSARLPRLGGLAKRGPQSAEKALRRPRQERNGDESRCLHHVDPGGSKRGEEEHRELAQATPVHRKRGRQLRIRPREARVVD